MSQSLLRRALGASLLIATAATAGAQGAAPQRFDILIRGGRVLDGTGNPWVRADVGIRGDRIAAIGDLRGATATTVVAAESLYVAPGFIDTHSHAGGSLAGNKQLGGAQQLLAQGLTTVFVNPDGGGSTDLAEQRKRLTANGIGVNVALMVPHGSVRGAVIEIGRAHV